MCKRKILFFCIIGIFSQPLFSQNDYYNNFNDSIFRLEEIEIRAERTQKALKGLMEGKIDVDISSLRTLPQFLGNVDLLRTMQLMPGVQTNGEIDSGFYVRGGEPGHNLITIDDATVYGAMHLLGFFSVFNSDHIKNTVLNKSFIAPEYGGRIGASVDIRSKDDIVDRTSFTGGIGLISTQGSLSMPIGKKSSLFISGRTSYLNLILGILNGKIDNYKTNYNFQDYNITYVFEPTYKDKISFNIYYGVDKLNINEQYFQIKGGLDWKNAVSSLKYKRIVSDNISVENKIIFTYYKNYILATMGTNNMGLPSDITDIGYKGALFFYLFGMKWHAGADFISHKVNTQYPDVGELFSDRKNEPPSAIRTFEYGAYISTGISVEKLFFDLGLRYGGVFQTGPYKKKIYDDNGKELYEKTYNLKDIISAYSGFEPRFGLKYEFDSNKRIIASYCFQRQYMNQVIVSGIGLPTDFWVPVSEEIKPQSAHSLTLGYFQSLINDDYEFSIDSYFKRMNDINEFGGELFDMMTQRYVLADHILYGTGYSYGVEFFFKKNRGPFTGWISYTLGKSIRIFDSINNGKPFPAKHDRRHDLSVVANYKLNRNWDFSGVFVYATGNAFTMPESLYLVGGNAINEYGPHNGSRLPDYHRLDLSVNYRFSRKKKIENCINLSLYNCYVRKNTIFVVTRVTSENNGEYLRIRPKGQSLYSIVPSISYSLKF